MPVTSQIQSQENILTRRDPVLQIWNVNVSLTSAEITCDVNDTFCNLSWTKLD